MGVGAQTLISFGQDECIFNPCIFRHKAWTHKNKTRPRLKDKGYGLMISEFLLRVFGFGTMMTEDALEKVNETR